MHDYAIVSTLEYCGEDIPIHEYEEKANHAIQNLCSVAIC